MGTGILGGKKGTVISFLLNKSKNLVPLLHTLETYTVSSQTSLIHILVFSW